MIAPGWFVKTEYRYSSYNSKQDHGAIGAPAAAVLTAINLDYQAAGPNDQDRAGLQVQLGSLIASI